MSYIKGLKFDEWNYRLLLFSALWGVGGNL